MRREERVTVQGPVKEQQPDGMSHRGLRGSSLGVCSLGDGRIPSRAGGYYTRGVGSIPANRFCLPQNFHSTAFPTLSYHPRLPYNRFYRLSQPRLFSSTKLIWRFKQFAQLLSVCQWGRVSALGASFWATFDLEP